jgi:hypothetical protein
MLPQQTKASQQSKPSTKPQKGADEGAGAGASESAPYAKHQRDEPDELNGEDEEACKLDDPV